MDDTSSKEAIDIYADTLDVNGETVQALAGMLRARNGNAGDIGKTLGLIADDLSKIAVTFLSAEAEFRKTGLS